MIGPFPQPWEPVPMEYPDDDESAESGMMLRNPETGEVVSAKDLLKRLSNTSAN